MKVAGRKPDLKRARNAATELLRECQISKAPVPIERIIKAQGIVLQYAPLEEAISGMAYIKDGLSMIGVNALHHPNRQRFSLAHELGHHALHRSEITDVVHVDTGLRVLLRDDLASQGVDANEIEANAFASELLMPRDFLVDTLKESSIDMDDDAQIEDLAKKFKVSASALRYRLARLMDETERA